MDQILRPPQTEVSEVFEVPQIEVVEAIEVPQIEVCEVFEVCEVLPVHPPTRAGWRAGRRVDVGRSRQTKKYI